MIRAVLNVSRWVLVGGVAALVVGSAACTVTTTRIIAGDGGLDDGGRAVDAAGSPPGSSSGSSGDATAPPKDSAPPRDATGGGGVCDPPATVTYTKTWLVPHAHQAACTQADIDLFRKVCLGVQADGGAACKSFTGTASGKACEECILPSTGTQVGPLVATGGFVAPNIAGCIALAQGTQADGAGCASASLYLTECRAVACGPCANDLNTTTDQINACDSAADVGACSAESTAAACLDQLADAGGAAANCLAGTDFDATYARIVPIFCLE